MSRKLLGHLEAHDRIESDDAAFGQLAQSFRRSQVAGTLAWLESNREALADAAEREEGS